MSRNSHKSDLAPIRRSFARFIVSARRALQLAFEDEAEKNDLTQQMIAQILDIDKSIVSRRLSGEANLTLKSFHDLAFALNRRIHINLEEKGTAMGDNKPKSVAAVPPKLLPDLLPRSAAGQKLNVKGGAIEPEARVTEVCP